MLGSSSDIITGKFTENTITSGYKCKTNGKGASQTMHERVKLRTTIWHTSHYYYNKSKSSLSYISLSYIKRHKLWQIFVLQY